MFAWPDVSLPILVGESKPLRLFDTASDELRPLAPGQLAQLYVCGITPYDATHIGHASTYLAFDLIVRNLREAGHHVRYVQNVTDVDDPLLERAAATGAQWDELARSQIDLFRTDMTALRVVPPNDFVSVIDSIELIAAKIEGLADRGAAYQVEDDWYFAVESDPSFGQVAHLPLDEEIVLSRERGGDPDRPGKRHPLDSLLWLAARPGEPKWPSALGDGRPGWHIECVSIALDHIGVGFDLQGGGRDLIFPHHEMTASQAQVLCDEAPFARFYIHAGLVALDGEKMSKSRGNLVFVSGLLEGGVDPMAIRLAILANHYRSDWEWTPELLDQAQNRLDAWRAAVAPPTGPAAERTLEAIRSALAGDLQAPIALQAVDRWVEEQRLRGGGDDSAPGIISRAVDALLGVAL